MKDIFLYRDYRSYIRDWYAHNKLKRSGFSYRNVARRSKLFSHSFFRNLLLSRKHISEKSASPLATFLGLNHSRREYFILLVHLAHAQTPTLRRLIKRQLVKLADANDLVAHAADPRLPLHDRQEIVLDDHTLIVQTLSHTPGFKADPHWIHERLNRTLSLVKIRHALKVLERVGLNGPQPSNDLMDFYGTQPTFRPSPYHKAMIRRSIEAYDHLPSERAIHAATLFLSEGTFLKLKPRLQNALLKVLSDFQEFHIEDGPMFIYQLNAVLFPLVRLRDPLRNA